MYLLIDYREGDFIKKLSEFCIIENEIPKAVEINGDEICIKITNLPIADFIITEDIHDTTKIKLAIERKSVSDLYSSIIDGRFREQKTRLLNSLSDPNKICYLIEGLTSKLVTFKKINMIRGSILNLVFKHQYKVITTQHKLDTFEHLLLLYKKYKSGDLDNINQNINQNIKENSCIKLVKKADSAKDSKLLNQLCLIPGVSPKIANAIIKWLSELNDQNYCIKTIINLYDQKSESESELLLSEIPLPKVSVDGDIISTRKVGKALSKKIYQYFCT